MTTLAVEDAAPRRGEVDVYEWRDDGNCRHVLVMAGLRPHPWTAFARAKRNTNGLPYATWKATTRDALKAALARTGTAPYPRAAVLGLAMAFGARREVMPGQQRATSVRSWDLRNLEKALEDVLTGVMYADDDQVRFSGPGSARDETEDWWAAHLWGSDCSWNEAWAPYSVPVVEVEHA